jgi:hypothetical protein
MLFEKSITYNICFVYKIICNFSTGRAYSLVKGVVTMFKHINRKPLRVSDDEKLNVDWVYLTVTVIGYGLIFWIIRLAAHTFLGGL